MFESFFESVWVHFVFGRPSHHYQRQPRIIKHKSIDLLSVSRVISCIAEISTRLTECHGHGSPDPAPQKVKGEAPPRHSWSGLLQCCGLLPHLKLCAARHGSSWQDAKLAKRIWKSHGGPVKKIPKPPRSNAEPRATYQLSNTRGQLPGQNYHLFCALFDHFWSRSCHLHQLFLDSDCRQKVRFWATRSSLWAFLNASTGVEAKK